VSDVTTGALLAVETLSQFYGQSRTLWEVDLELAPGDCLSLIGRNGVGKTTLLSCLMGLIPLSSGRIVFNGTEITSLAPEVRAPLGVGYVPQGRMIFPLLTVEENLRIGLGARADKLREIPSRIFELFPVLKSMLSRRGGDLSGGQQQQLAIGRALAIDPKLLILDEPTEGIQPNIVQQIGDAVERLRASRQMREEIGDAIDKARAEYGVTVLLVEQKLAFARRLAQRFCILDRGRVVAGGPMEELTETLVDRHLKV
jgi:urea transport system ATP-binding protein